MTAWARFAGSLSTLHSWLLWVELALLALSLLGLYAVISVVRKRKQIVEKPNADSSTLLLKKPLPITLATLVPKLRTFSTESALWLLRSRSKSQKLPSQSGPSSDRVWTADEEADNLVKQGLIDTAKAEEYKRRLRDGWSRWAAMVVCGGICSVALLFSGRVKPLPVVHYTCPDYCLGVVRVEGVNAIETVNLKTGQRREWRFCPDRVVANPKPPSIVFKGYVVEIHAIETIVSVCDDLNGPGLDVHIIRGKEMNVKPVMAVTHFDGPDRPVLANNCWNAPWDGKPDATTECEGGDARFDEQLTQLGGRQYAKSAGW